jgi:hypothetical protein
VSPARHRLREQYEEAFRAYLRAPSELGLQDAYELGRQAVQVGLSMLELTDSLHEVLTAELADPATGQEPAALAGSARVFLNETLSTFDMASRGFREASETVRLEQRHSARLRELADAFVELNRSLRPEEILRVVTARARGMHEVSSARVLLVPGGESGVPSPAGAPIDVVDGDEVAIDEELARAVLGGQRPLRGEARGNPLLVAPLLGGGGQPVGVIQLAGPSSGGFTDQDEAMLV